MRYSVRFPNSATGGFVFHPNGSQKLLKQEYAPHEPPSNSDVLALEEETIISKAKETLIFALV